jgi:hypothetical protein
VTAGYGFDTHTISSVDVIVIFGGSTLGECARLLTENEAGSNPARRAN